MYNIYNIYIIIYTYGCALHVPGPPPSYGQGGSPSSTSTTSSTTVVVLAGESATPVHGNFWCRDCYNILKIFMLVLSNLHLCVKRKWLPMKVQRSRLLDAPLDLLRSNSRQNQNLSVGSRK